MRTGTTLWTGLLVLLLALQVSDVWPYQLVSS
jgi:hypothetical protein